MGVEGLLGFPLREDHPNASYRHLARLEMMSPIMHNGVIDYLGSRGYTEVWKNPHTLGVVTATLSTTLINAALNVIDHASTPAATTNVANSWFKIDFGVYRVAPSMIVIEARDDAASDNPRTFDVQGSDDDVTWTTLRSFTGVALFSPWQTPRCTYWAGELPPYGGEDPEVNRAWRYLRIYQTGVTQSGQNYLVLGEVEFYGDLYVA